MTEQITTTQEETTYLSCAETAKLVRKALKEKFPKQKFSVRSSVYSMGASIDVSWVDGVDSNEVKEITEGFCGAGFDGMIDYKFYKKHWLLPNGEVVFARSEGSQCTGGVYSECSNEKPHPDAKEVSLGADYVFAQRELSEEVQLKIAKQLAKEYKTEFTGLYEQPIDCEVLRQGYRNWAGIVSEILDGRDLTDFDKLVATDCTGGSLKDFWDIKKLNSGGNK